MLVCLNCQETLRAKWKQEQEALLEQFAQISGDCTSEGRRLLSQHEWSLELALCEYEERTLRCRRICSAHSGELTFVPC